MTLKMNVCDLFYHVQYFSATLMRVYEVITIISRDLSETILWTQTLSACGKGHSDKCHQKQYGGPCVFSGMASCGDTIRR